LAEQALKVHAVFQFLRAQREGWNVHPQATTESLHPQTLEVGAAMA
jgi:hypothetical protein